MGPGVDEPADVIDWEVFLKARAELGPTFVRILGYFREDGVKSLSRIEQAMREGVTAQLVVPAHTLKGEARQFGAEPLADTAEEIEMTARRALESGRFPDELVADVVRLRRLFERTVAAFDQEMNPLMQRQRGGFGRREANTSFGRA